MTWSLITNNFVLLSVLDSNSYTNYILKLLSGYNKAGVGENCPAAGLITSKVICEHALRSLGLRLHNLDFIYLTERPAGCYYLDTLMGDGRRLGMFNKIIDPSLTNPKIFGEKKYGGVCITSKGKNCE